jgi:uncharacterized membrane protein
MAFCKACGHEIGTASFCPKCGASQGAVAAPAGAPVGGAPVAASTASPTEGMQENVASLVCYFFGWVSGLIFLLIDKRPVVRFHGAQSIALNISFFVVWCAFWILTVVLGMITAALHFPVGFLMAFLFPVLIIGFIVVWIYCMYKAYQGEKFKLPIIGNIVENMVK